MRNINKSQVRAAVRRAIEAFNRGGDALAVLNEESRALGLGGVGMAEGRRFQQAYAQRGEQGAVDTAIAALRDFGHTVTDDEAEVPLATFAFADAAPVAEPVVAVVGVAQDGDVEKVAERLADLLFEGGRAAAITYAMESARTAGLTVTDAQVEEIVKNFAEALRDNGIYSAVEALEEAYEALTATPEVAQAGGEETLEVRVARLEGIARANGLL